MKTLPILVADFTKRDKNTALIKKHIRQDRAKLNKILLINTPEQKPDLPMLFAEKYNTDYSEKIKQINKEIFENK